MSENGETYTGGKNFTLPPTVTAMTNVTSDCRALFLAVQDSSIGDLVTHSLTHSLTH